MEESRFLRQDLGFALSCSLRFQEAIEVLKEQGGRALVGGLA